MKKIISITLITLLIISSLTAFAYDDIGNSPYKEEIYYLSRYAIMKREQTSFRPNDGLTRAEAAKYLLRASNVNNESASNYNEQISQIKYSDISNEHWGYHYIYAATVREMMNGYSDKTVRPDENVTAIELITMAVRAVGYEEKAKEAGGYPDGYIKIAEEIGITKKLNLAYDQIITREQTAMIIYNTIRVPLNLVVGFEMKMVENENGEMQEEAVPVWKIADGREDGNVVTLFYRLHSNNTLKEEN